MIQIKRSKTFNHHSQKKSLLKTLAIASIADLDKQSKSSNLKPSTPTIAKKIHYLGVVTIPLVDELICTIDGLPPPFNSLYVSNSKNPTAFFEIINITIAKFNEQILQPFGTFN